MNLLGLGCEEQRAETTVLDGELAQLLEEPRHAFDRSGHGALGFGGVEGSGTDGGDLLEIKPGLGDFISASERQPGDSHAAFCD